MLVDPEQLLAALRLPATSHVDVEPLGALPDSPESVSISTPDGGHMLVTVRRSHDPELAENNVAVLERLNAMGFASVPRLLAIVSGAAVEEEAQAVRALGVLPPEGSCEAAIDALAALHSLPVREGLRWEMSPADLYPIEDIPLHRLGFTAEEREDARPHVAAAQQTLVETPFGFCHGRPTAMNVVLAPGAAQLVNFELAGFGAQFVDVAAFLLTVGLYGEQRRDLAIRYAKARSLPAEETADLVDAVGLIWAISEQLLLPRRLMENYGDDVTIAALRTVAARIDESLRDPAGRHPAAVGIRSALWG